MKSQTNHEVTWTSLELDGLLEDEESHLHFTRTIKHLALHPYHLNHVQRGLSQILKSSLNTHDRELKGFVLAFRNPKLLSNLGEILYDSPFIHVDIEADFYLFRPTVGSFLKGIVNKKGLDHIVVLVHKIYTVSIPKPDDTEEWPGELVEIGQEVKCCVKQIDNKSKPPFICATLKSNYSQGCRLPESTNNIDNTDSAIESSGANSATRIDGSINEVSEDDGISEKERKKDRKRHKKSREDNSEFILKIENESESNDNIGNDISGSIKSEKKRQYQNMQDAVLNTDDSLNNSEADNVPKKRKKNNKMSKSLLNDSTVLSEHTESRKAVKRENSIPLDSITETEGKKRKKHARKSRESDSESVFTTENEEKLINNTLISGRVKSEKEEQHTHRNHSTSNANLFSEVSVSKKHKKNKKSPMKMSDSESEGHIVKIKIEKPDPFIDRIINESQISSRGENQVVQNSDENVDLPKFLKKENSNKYDYMSDKERKKSSKKHAVTSRESQSEYAFKIKNEDDTINDVSSASDRERKKSPKKHIKADSDTKSELRIKSENDANNDMDISDKEKKKSPKKQAKASKDSDSKSGLGIKSEDDTTNDIDISDKEKKKSPKKQTKASKDSDSKSGLGIKSEDDTTNDMDISDKEKKKSAKKQAKASKDSDSKSGLRIKSEDDTTSDIDISDKEKKKSAKKQAKASKDSDSKSGLRIKSEDDKDTSDKERRKSPKKYANLLGDSDAEIRIKSENITNDVKDISRAIKYDSEESQHAKHNTSEIYSNSSNLDLDHASEKFKKKKKTLTILSDSELKYPIKAKAEKV